MQIENIERVVVERVLSIAPGIASAEVIYTIPFTLPTTMEEDAYTGVVVVGKGKVIPGANVQLSGLPSLKGDIHEKTFAASFFVLVIRGKIHVYLENQSIMNF